MHQDALLGLISVVSWQQMDQWACHALVLALWCPAKVANMFLLGAWDCELQIMLVVC
jgi:hypothetical protein